MLLASRLDGIASGNEEPRPLSSGSSTLGLDNQATTEDAADAAIDMGTDLGLGLDEGDDNDANGESSGLLNASMQSSGVVSAAHTGGRGYKHRRSGDGDEGRDLAGAGGAWDMGTGALDGPLAPLLRRWEKQEL